MQGFIWWQCVRNINDRMCTRWIKELHLDDWPVLSRKGHPPDTVAFHTNTLTIWTSTTTSKTLNHCQNNQFFKANITLYLEFTKQVQKIKYVQKGILIGLVVEGDIWTGTAITVMWYSSGRGSGQGEGPTGGRLLATWLSSLSPSSPTLPSLSPLGQSRPTAGKA